MTPIIADLPEFFIQVPDMSKQRHFIFGFLLTTLFLLQGCGRLTAPPAPDSLVIDLAAVARATGRDDAISSSLSQARDTLNQQLQTLTDSMNVELDKVRKTADEKTAKAAQSEYTRLSASAAQQLRESRLSAQQKLNSVQDKLIAAFRKEIKGIAVQIARQRGASRVVLASTDLLWLDPKIDITDEIIARLRARAEMPAAADSGNATPTDTDTRREIDKLNQLVDKVEQHP